MANEIVEREEGTEDVVLVGIHTGGVFLAHRLAQLLKEIEGGKPIPEGTVDITLYRDDLFRGLPRPEVGPTELPFRLEDKKVVLVDDVLYTGRTIRAALDVLLDYGRPRRVRLAILVDRGHRELPIQADYIGLRTETQANQTIKVRLAERGRQDQVILLEQEG
jgi:pyrimidine operon attenuation protein/uracil phosphoribosyltransferase